MTKRNESRPTNDQEGTGRNVSITDGNVRSHEKKNFGTIIGTKMIAGSEVRVVEHQGRIGIPEIDVARGLDQDESGFRQLLKRNFELLDDYPWEVTVPFQGQGRKMRLLTLDNVRASILLVDHNVKDPVRREFLISRKREYIRIINDYYSGKQDVRLTPEWQEKRKKVATNWNRLCDELKIKVVPTIRNPAHERFVYINEAKNLNKNVYGYHEAGLRDKSTLKQIEALENAEAWATAFAHLNITDGADRKALVKEMLNQHYPDLEYETALDSPVPASVKISAKFGQRVLIEFTAVTA